MIFIIYINSPVVGRGGLSKKSHVIMSKVKQLDYE